MSIIKLVAVVCVILIIFLSDAAPVPEDGKAEILTYKNENSGQGNYEFSFETSNGISHTETGKLVNVGEPDEHLEVEGAYSYTDPEGKLVVVNYTADENGYHISLPISLVSAAPPHVIASLLG